MIAHFARFLLLMVLGMSLMWGLMPRRQVTSGFFRIQMFITLGLSVLILLIFPGGVASNGSGVSAEDHLGKLRLWQGVTLIIPLTSYIGSVVWLLERRTAGTVCCFTVLFAALASLFLSQGDNASASTLPAERLFLLGSWIATAGVLGGALVGMLLGHWYLTATTMSIEPLKRICLFFGIAVGIRLILSVVGWWLAGERLTDGTHWTWFALRWLAGIAAPLALSVMALHILRYRNTQAATGVLFAGVILTFIGEMSAALLYSELHVPL